MTYPTAVRNARRGHAFRATRSDPQVSQSSLCDSREAREKTRDIWEHGASFPIPALDASNNHQPADGPSPGGRNYVEGGGANGTPRYAPERAIRAFCAYSSAENRRPGCASKALTVVLCSLFTPARMKVLTGTASSRLNE